MDTSVRDRIREILAENPAVEDQAKTDDGIKAWIGTRAYKGDKQALLDDLNELNGVEVTDEGVENDWRIYRIAIPPE